MGENGTDTVALCSALVAAASPTGAEGAAADVAEAFFRTHGFDDVWRTDCGSVLARRCFSRARRGGPSTAAAGAANAGAGAGAGAEPPPLRLHLDGHLDVVAALTPERWTHAPFSGLVDADAGRLWGRGTTDTKGGLAGMMCAVASLPADAFDGVVTISASVGEERFEGASLARILRAHPADAVLVAEPTELAVGICQKGRAGITLTARGRAAHSSVPEEGVNAVYVMLDAIARVRAMPLPAAAPSSGAGVDVGRAAMELIEIVSEPFPGDSVVPHGCTARFDRRLLPGDSLDGVLAAIRAVLRGLPVDVSCPTEQLHCYTGLELALRDYHPAWTTAVEHPLVAAALRGLRAAGVAPVLFAIPFCTHGSGSAGELGIPTIVCGPSSVRLAHVVDEHIEIADLVRGTRAYAAIVEEFFRSPPEAQQPTDPPL